MTGAVSFVVPPGIDDPARVSGGNVYDRRVRDGLTGLGWRVRMAEAAPADAGELRTALRGAADGGLVVVDGLLAGVGADVLVESAARLRLVVLVHMLRAALPDADAGVVADERRALGVARLLITPSQWLRGQLAGDGVGIPIVVAPPGTATAGAATGTPGGCALLCVGVVAPHKGQDVLIDALTALGPAPDWVCTFAGATEADPAFVAALLARAAALGKGERIRFAGVQTDAGMDGLYRRTDLLVAPSRAEAYGMAIAEARARGIPVIASRVGGIPEAVGPDGAALLVSPGDSAALADALTRWMTDAGLRRRLTSQARDVRLHGRAWEDTVARVATALADVP
ncbi:glycosyltransferase family 4 protein [Microbacterium sp. zg-YB36]|uniref:glycosyltransferase family 4 protein n=1 Tax=Microbacterium sp. zg-YB36 TaxID=2969407 RepID=UPI00214BF109|nr:glycosyltransferase family 4 protein [Microbacterium sp. zg-YB36]MDL5351683.1 glycosyltransferase family 4 protein [Microbacterium sp. zg-YB36]